MEEKRVTVDQAMAIAMDHFKSHRLPDAEKIYLDVLKSLPDHAFAIHNLGLIAYSVGRYEAAAEYFRKAVSIRGDIASFYSNLGEALRSLGQLEEAITAYGQAISLAPNNSYAINNLGITLYSSGRQTEAGEHFRRAIELRPDFFHARIELARVMLFEKRTEEAIAELDRAASHANEVGFPLAKLGAFYAAAGRRDEARKYLKAAIKVDPTDRDGSKLVLASLGNDELPARASDAFLLKLYSERASTWDQNIIGKQSYRGMDLVANELRRHAKSSIVVLDAGCGTGLVGSKVRNMVSRLDGVDLSADMLVKAKEKNIYDRLIQSDLIAFLCSNQSKYDAITSAATLIHFGNLTPVFKAVASSLKPGGLFVFTVFSNPDDYEFSSASDGLALGGCYLHGKNYLVRVAMECGFKVVSLAQEIHEYNSSEPVMGLIVTLCLI